MRYFRLTLDNFLTEISVIPHHLAGSFTFKFQHPHIQISISNVQKIHLHSMFGTKVKKKTSVLLFTSMKDSVLMSRTWTNLTLFDVHVVSTTNRSNNETFPHCAVTHATMNKNRLYFRNDTKKSLQCVNLSTGGVKADWIKKRGWVGRQIFAYAYVAVHAKATGRL